MTDEELLIHKSHDDQGLSMCKLGDSRRILKDYECINRIIIKGLSVRESDDDQKITN